MKVFYIDDDKSNTILFKKSMPQTFDCHIFTSPLEALALLNESKPDVIVSDEDMPQMRGTELLKIASAALPASLRILVTGKVDIDVLQKETPPGLIHFFVGKPYDPNFIISRVHLHFGEQVSASPTTSEKTQVVMDKEKQTFSRMAYETTMEKFKRYKQAQHEAKLLEQEMTDKKADLFMHLGSAINFKNFDILLRMSLEDNLSFDEFLEIYWRFNDIKKGRE
jgi:response regulator RpfG family c-di-GMP phosphodiesterase